MSLDKERFADYLNANAHPHSIGRCAAAVRKGMEAGGLNTNGRPSAAKDYAPFLEKLGARIVPSDGYTPLVGDIAVFEGNASHPYGHIQAFTGNHWVSDFHQAHFQPYRVNPTPSVIFRFPD